jgi:UDP-galactopyranose mutase
LKNVKINKYIIVGAGFAGAVIARQLAESAGSRVLVIDRRSHIGGNAYDCADENGILIHKYGPHVFHTNNKRVFDFLSRFTEWRKYEHRVMANVYGQLMPLPFNLKSLCIAFGGEKAAALQNKLINTYGNRTKIGILELKKNPDEEIREIADYIYTNIFLYYTVKQWGSKPEDIDQSVTARVPVFISEDDRYFQDEYQFMPDISYAELFKNMLDHPDIQVQLNTDAKDVITLDNGKIYLNGDLFEGKVIYTGALDELFGRFYGRLPYRTLKFEFETHDTEWVQPCGTINYTVDQPYTRITEFKHLTGQINKFKTTTMKEYSFAYEGKSGEIPYYPVSNPESSRLYNQYLNLIKDYPQIHLAGRMAEFKYYNMDAVVERALDKADELISLNGA